MGATLWTYVVPYQDDLAAAIKTLHRQVFDSGDYFWHRADLPASLHDLWRDETAQGGTHSILDINWLIEADEPEQPGRIRPLTTAERLETFGADRPTRSDFERAQ